MFEKPYLVDIDTAAFSATEQLAREIGVIATLAAANAARLILCASVESPPAITSDSIPQDRILAVRKEPAHRMLRERNAKRAILRKERGQIQTKVTFDIRAPCAIG